jgi:hypothetical protein
MRSKRLTWIPLAAACAISLTYIFVYGVDWGFTVRSGTLPSAIVTCLILSVWASVPYLILFPIARRDGQLLFTILAVLVILAFGKYSLDKGRQTPGDNGGSYIVVPLQQMALAALIVFGWRGVRRIAR